MFSNSPGHNPGERQRQRQRPARRRAERPPVRPQVVALEDRLLPSVFWVTNTMNDGDGSLHMAIENADANPGSTIAFDIEPGGPATIKLTSPLPTIFAPTIIDGTSQAGWIDGPIVQVDGSNSLPLSNGLTITADGCKVKGLELTGFHDGIGLYSNNNVISGDELLSNNYGIEIRNAGSGNVIGGTTGLTRNLISFNKLSGVYIHERSTGNLVEGNYIGTQQDGDSALPNGVEGVLIAHGASNNTIGGTAGGAGNLISGNLLGGLVIENSAAANLVQGNKIGTNADGTAALVNGNNGVFILASSGNTIGGTAAGAGNLISGNGRYGIRIESGATANVVQGNEIGTNAAGTAAVRNGLGGVIIVASSGNTVGGTATGAGNLISGNGFDGILITGVANLVQGNMIGTNAAGTGAVANGLSGVHIFASNNTVGGTAAGAANTIAFNKAVGVFVDSGTGNAIRQNSIFANAGLGIRLNPGANNNQPAPTLSAARFIPFVNLLTAQGTLTGVAGSQVTLEFFASPAGDPEGKVYLGSLVVTIGANGTARFTFTLQTNKVSPGMVITATATDATNGTSQFSAGRTV
jgi:titin